MRDAGEGQVLGMDPKRNWRRKPLKHLRAGRQRITSIIPI
jgi:hypothetical protein